MTDKHTINLLQPELLPENPLWTLSRVCIIWGICFVVMAFWTVVSTYKVDSSEKNLKSLQQQERAVEKQVAQLEKRMSEHKAGAALVERLEVLKHVSENKKSLLIQLTDNNSTFVAGFASAMTELANLHHRDVTLTSVNISREHVSFSGLALTAESVPAWLDRFEQSRLLSGKNFVNFSLKENEDNVTEFIVSSRIAKGAEK